jgi:hypothetical protein
MTTHPNSQPNLTPLLLLSSKFLLVLVPVSTIFRFWRKRPIAVNFHDLIVEHQNQAKHQMAAESQTTNQLPYQDHHQTLLEPLFSVA